jgi:chitinase
MKTNLFFIAFFIIVAQLLFNSCSKKEITDSQNNIEKEELFVAGYLPYYGMERFDFNMLEHIDRLYYFSIAPDTLGNYILPDIHQQNISLLNNKLSTLNTELFIVIGGWYESETIFPMAENSTKRELYVNKLVDFCISNNIDGVDLDWEAYPTSVPQSDYLALVEILSVELKKHNLLFTVAVAASHYSFSALIVDKVDQLNIMSYGILDDNGDQVTMTQLTGWLKNYDDAQIPRSKLIVGVPFYGKRPFISGDTSPRAILYSSIVNNASPGSFVNKYKNYGFNGRELMRTKTNYLRQYSYFGIMSWELTQDVPYSSDYSLLKSIVNTAK